ncbi:Uncharacterised protein [uncultured archaeon]|nr:Uncharacterised protein [uncultured archaeon]
MVLNFASKVSGMAELNGKELRVLSVVREHWPISALEIAGHFSENVSSREHKKRHSTNYTYYLKKLIARRLVLSKRIGNALVVWPVEVEAYRTIHNILRDSNAAHHDALAPAAENEFAGSVPMGVR